MHQTSTLTIRSISATAILQHKSRAAPYCGERPRPNRLRVRIKSSSMRQSLVGIILLFTFCPFLLAQSPSVGVDRVIVYKRERKLVLLSQGKELRSFKIA